MNAASIGALAVRALLREVDTWPKPGLVSPIDSGSHPDMDAALLRRSALGLQPFFVQLAAAGASDSDMSVLRRIGMAAETAMLEVTAAVNTHRGAIFGLGLLCAAAGLASNEPWRAVSLGAVVRALWGESIASMPSTSETHGATVQRRYGAGGARVEAAGGFTHVYRVGWPALRHGRHLTSGDERAAQVQCCFALIAALADTNLMHRGGLTGLLFAREAAGDFIARGGVGCSDWYAYAWATHAAFVSRRLSPGGCADLLAMTLFVDAWESAAHHDRTRCDRESVLV